MWITGWTDLEALSEDVGLRAEPIRELLEGRSRIWDGTLDTWCAALQQLRKQRSMPDAVGEAIESLPASTGTADSEEQRQSASQVDPLLWFYRNCVYRWPDHPYTRAAEWAMFYEPVLVAHMLVDTTIHADFVPECLCDVLARLPEPVAYRADKPGDTLNLSTHPPRWRRKTADFLEVWQLPPTHLSRSTIRRRANKDPLALAQHMIQARIDSRPCRDSARDAFDPYVDDEDLVTSVMDFLFRHGSD